MLPCNNADSFLRSLSESKVKDTSTASSQITCTRTLHFRPLPFLSVSVAVTYNSKRCRHLPTSLQCFLPNVMVYEAEYARNIIGFHVPFLTPFCKWDSSKKSFLDPLIHFIWRRNITTYVNIYDKEQYGFFSFEWCFLHVSCWVNWSLRFHYVG